VADIGPDVSWTKTSAVIRENECFPSSRAETARGDFSDKLTYG
jgi:hypothetical protein